MTDKISGNNLLHITECAFGDHFKDLTQDKEKATFMTELKRMLRQENNKGQNPLFAMLNSN